MPEINNDDWLKYISWDVRANNVLVTTLAGLLAALNATTKTPQEQKEAVKTFMKLPVWNSAPKSLKGEVATFIVNN